MYVLTNFNADEKDEFATAVIAVSESIEKLQAHAQEIVEQAILDEELPETTVLQWGDWAGAKSSTWIVASYTWAERYEIEEVEVLA